MKKTPKPTESEVSILAILWEQGPSDVRTVAKHLSRERSKEVGYTTALKLLQLMHEKDLVVRDESSRSHRYAAKHPPATMKKRMVRDFAGKVFGGNVADLAMHALSTRKVSPEQLESLRNLLNELEKKEKK